MRIIKEPEKYDEREWLLSLSRKCPNKRCVGEGVSFTVKYLDANYKTSDDLSRLYFTCKRCKKKFLLNPFTTPKLG